MEPFHYAGDCLPVSEALEEVLFDCLRLGVKPPERVGLSPRVFRALYQGVRNDARYLIQIENDVRLTIVLRNHGITFAEDATISTVYGTRHEFAPGVTVSFAW